MNIEVKTQTITAGLPDFDGTAGKGEFSWADLDGLPSSACIGFYLGVHSDGPFTGYLEVYAVESDKTGPISGLSLAERHLVHLVDRKSGPLSIPRWGHVSPVIRLPRNLTDNKWFKILVGTPGKTQPATVSVMSWFDVGDPYNAT